MKHISIGVFAKEVLHKPLYPYQIEVGDAIIESVLEGKGLTFSVMFSRQMGKNQLSAVLESYLLCCMPDGAIVKAAPTYKPQTVNSRLRLLSMLECSFTRERMWRSYGYIIGLAPTPDLRDAQVGPRLMLFSAGPGASIVGATASILLEIDEAQDVAIEKFDRDLRPMASTTNATTVAYGTAWSDDTLLAILSANNKELEREDGIKRHFEYDWRTLAAINPNYKAFVENEIRRLGEDHISIRTQYRLLTISGAGFLLNEVQRHLLRGSHDWEGAPNDEEDYYVASCDLGGEDRPKQGQESQHGKRDSTVVSIAKVSINELGLPMLSVVHQQVWTGAHYLEVYAQITAICEQWSIRKLIVDKTGLGEVMASLLEAKLGEEKVEAFHFTRPSKSKLTFQFLSLINSGRLKMYRQDEAPQDVYEEAWRQLRMARYSVPAPNMLDMRVDPADGHDDILISIALLGEAVREWSAPAQEAAIIVPRRLYGGESRY